MPGQTPKGDVMETEMAKIALFVEDGLIQAIKCSSTDIDVFLVDFDDKNGLSEDFTSIEMEDGSTKIALLKKVEIRATHSDPQFLESLESKFSGEEDNY
jgi:hypothetical protein